MRIKKARRVQTFGEELANSITHGIAAALSVAALIVMVSYTVSTGDTYRIVGAVVFGVTMVVLYLASTLYHSLHWTTAHIALRKFDHCAIYLLIAGTYTPFTLVSLQGPVGWTMFGIIWALAVTGVIFKLFFIHRFEIMSVLIYVAMGWLAALAFKPTLEALQGGGMAWLVAGGLSYTVGVIFYAWRNLPYHHTVWHLFVMAGTFCHYWAVQFYVLPHTTI